LFDNTTAGGVWHISSPANIAANSITNAQLALVGANTLKGNNTGSASSPIDLTVSQVYTLLGATSIPTNNAIVTWDSNKILNLSNISTAINNTAVSGGTTTLTGASVGVQSFSGGSSGQTVVLPTGSSLSNGTQYRILNQSTGVITVQRSDTTLLTTIAANTDAIVLLLSNGTTAGTWHVIIPDVAANSISNAQLTQMAALTLKGNNTGGTANAADLTVSQVQTLLGATATVTPNAIVEWDANGNLNANNLIGGYATTVTAAGTTTLLANSAMIQAFTGTTTQTVVLPVATTLNNGTEYVFQNASTGIVTINNSASTLIYSLPAVTDITITLINNTTSTGTWHVSAVSITNGSITNGQLATAPANTIKGNNTGATASVIDMTVTQAAVLLGTTTPTSNRLPLYDTHSGLFMNQIYITTAVIPTAGATTTITQNSAGKFIFTGTLNQTIQMSNGNTFMVGESYILVNNSTGIITVLLNDTTTVLTTIPAISNTIITCVTGSAGNGVWYVDNPGTLQSAANTLKGNNTGSAGATKDLTLTQVKTFLGVTSTPSGGSTIVAWDANGSLSAFNIYLRTNTTVTAGAFTTLTVASGFTHKFLQAQRPKPYYYPTQLPVLRVHSIIL